MKCGKKCANETIVLGLLLIGSKSGTSFLNQSGCVVSVKAIIVRRSSENCSNMEEVLSLHFIFILTERIFFVQNQFCSVILQCVPLF